MNAKIPVILASLMASFAFAALPASADDTADADAADTPKAKTCVQLRQIRQTHVLDDQRIVFEMNGRNYYLNNLPNRCPRLGFEEAFSYATSLTQLCNVDIITVIQNFGGRIWPGASCGLGKFEPITKEQFAALKKGETLEEETTDEATESR